MSYRATVPSSASRPNTHHEHPTKGTPKMTTKRTTPAKKAAQDESLEDTNSAMAKLMAARAPRTAKRAFASNPGDPDELATLRMEAASQKVRAEDSELAEEERSAAAALAEEATEKADAFRDAMPVTTFHFRSIGLEARDKLRQDHAPSDAQRRRYQKMGMPLMWDPEEYPKALVAATCTVVVLPDGTEMDGLSYAQVAMLWENPGYSDQDLNELYAAADSVDSKSSVVAELGKA